MSSGAVRNGHQDPLPLFSPTLTSSREQEHLLHSVFSPTLRGGVTSWDKRDREKREREKREKIALAAQRVKPRTQSSLSTTVPFASPRSIRISLPKTPGSKTPLARKSFYSPSSDFLSPVSTLSVFTCASTCSFKSLPIDMLSFDYVSNCDSPKALQQIVDTLSAEQQYPSLLKRAKKQLESIHETTARHDGIQMSHLTDSQRQNTLCVSSANDESSLAMSLSSSMLDGADVEGADERKEESKVLINSTGGNDLEVKEVKTCIAPSSDRQVSRPSGRPVIATNESESVHAKAETKLLAEIKQLEEQVHSMEASKRKDNANLLLKLKSLEEAKKDAECKVAVLEKMSGLASARAKTEIKLLAEVQQLEEQVHSMKASKRKDSVNLLLKLKSLEEAKEDAERKVAMLERMVASTSANTREVMSTLASVRQESQLLQDNIRDERRAARSKVEEAKAVEEALQKKIQSLSAQLSHFKGQSMDAYRSMEMRLRCQVQKECSQRDGDIRSLQQALQDARSALEAMEKERSATLRSIQLALGKSGDGVDSLSAMERMATVGSIARKLSSSRAATNALSKALTESEIDRKLASEARVAAKKRFDKSDALRRRLERENELLTKQVQELTVELERSRAHIDKLLKQKGKDCDDWRSKEKEYKQVINKLRAQVCGGEAVVSLAVYRKAVDEARARALECQDKRLEINTMTRRLNDLERRLNNDRPKVPTSRTPPSVQGAVAKVRKVTPLPVHFPENSNPNTPMSKNVRPPPPPSPPVAYRISAVREAGGRAGLCAKLKQMRRSPLANKNVNVS